MVLHLLGVALVQAVGQAVIVILPMIAQKRFHASELQTVLITAPPTILYVLSIFWNDMFTRLGGVWCFIAYWVLASLPLALIALARGEAGYWWLLAPHLVACAGGAGWPPLAGSLLKSFYAAQSRGRAYSIVWGGQMVASAVLGYAIGHVLTKEPDAFRTFIPGGVVLQLLGVLLLLALARFTGHLPDLAPAREAAHRPWSLRSALDPILHMTGVLKADPVFARYEGAYMTYGVGWMIGYALLPIMATQRLDLAYDQYALSTQVAYLGALVASIYPAAVIMDRWGALRATGLSFFLLALYPVGLMVVWDERSLLVVSALYGVAHSGASVGWMLGPVSLAPTPDRVPTYVAIHATLVGVRGALFQFLGVGIYLLCAKVLRLPLSVSFGVPFVIASGAYVWAGVQMGSLRRVMAAQGAKAS
ncbi:MAG: MFS transporter [Phycisphaerales bacterium]